MYQCPIGSAMSNVRIAIAKCMMILTLNVRQTASLSLLPIAIAIKRLEVTIITVLMMHANVMMQPTTANRP